MSSFSVRCYDLLSKVPSGRVTTYRELAHALGSRAYRAVGSLMKHNPRPSLLFPCHRVVRSNGEVGEYNGGVKKKIFLLRKEGVMVVKGKISDFDKVLFRFVE